MIIFLLSIIAIIGIASLHISISYGSEIVGLLELINRVNKKDSDQDFYT